MRQERANFPIYPKTVPPVAYFCCIVSVVGDTPHPNWETWLVNQFVAMSTINHFSLCRLMSFLSVGKWSATMSQFQFFFTSFELNTTFSPDAYNAVCLVATTRGPDHDQYGVACLDISYPPGVPVLESYL